MPLSSTTDVLEPSEAVATATEPSEALAAATEPSEATHTPAKPSEGPHAPGELSEAPDALPLAGFASLEAALAPAVSASLARHPDARPCFIGMHLLALLEGTPLPDAPPMAPRPRDDLRREVRLLEGTLTDALNRVQASGGTRASLFRRLAADLIDRLDDNRRHRANPYSDSQAIWERVAKGDVVLVRASWLLQRAGFVQCGDGKHNYLWVPHSPPQPLPRRQELESQYPEAIMPLDELQAQHRNFRYTSQEATSTAAGVAHTSNAWADGANSLPVLTVSHVWETASHPDPEGRTLRIIAAELADGGWDAFDERGMPAGAPSCGLPLYRVWGMEDVGVFWDWASLYQAPRSLAEEGCFRRAFSDMGLYFAHSLVTSYVVDGQDVAHLRASRDQRGWPCYEEAVSRLLKDSPPRGTYELPAWPFAQSHVPTASASPYAPYALTAHDDAALAPPLICSLWGKVVHVQRTDGGPLRSRQPLSRTRQPVPQAARDEYVAPSSAAMLLASKAERAAMARERQQRELLRRGAAREHEAAIREEAAALVKQARVRPPPLAPSRFAPTLHTKAFGDGSDCSLIAGLYRQVLEDGFGGLQRLRLAESGWGDEEVAQLAATLREVRASELLELDLSDNELWVDGEALAGALQPFRSSGHLFRRVPLATLITLRLRGCTSLVSLPASLGRLAALETLDAARCESLRALPESIGELCALRCLDLSECFSLGTLPASVARLESLECLTLDYCDSLTKLPDLSPLRASLHVELLPERLATWQLRGWRTYDFMCEGPARSTQSVDLGFLGTRTLPTWLSSLDHVEALNLTGCVALTDITAVSVLYHLRSLRLNGCQALTNLDGAQLPELSQLVHLDLAHCTGLISMPDLTANLSCECLHLPDHLTPWEEGGRKAWTYDPNAPKPPPKPFRALDEDDNSSAPHSDAPPPWAVRAAGDDGDECLSDAPASTRGLPSQSLELASLDWGDNELFSLSEALKASASVHGIRYNVERVASLNLSYNAAFRSAVVLGKVLSQLSRLRTLRLTNCLSLQGLPAGLGALMELRELHLDGCSSMVALPESVCELASLEVLALGNALKSLPDGLGQLTSLHTLHANNLFLLPALPSTFGGLCSLRELELYGWSRLTALPDHLFALPAIESLHLGGLPRSAPLRALPDAIRLSAPTLAHLDLSEWLSLEALPTAIGQLAALRSLHLSGCVSLHTLPEELGLALVDLENLDLGGCTALAALPSSIASLVSLKELNCSGCALPRLPEGLGSLPELKRLNLSMCGELSALCDPLPPALEALFLNHCAQLHRVPESLGTLGALQQLALNECAALECLPDLGALSELTQLGLVGCGGLEAMPTGLHRLIGCMVSFDDGDVVVGEAMS